MADLLLDLARRPLAKRLVKQLKLPIPLPEPLTRSTELWQEQPLAHNHILVTGKAQTPFMSEIKAALKAEGAQLVENRVGPHALSAIVCDATSFHRVEDMGSLFDAFKSHLGNLCASGRIIIIGCSKVASPSPEDAAAAAALKGFVKSLAKEVGRRGITCNLLTLNPAQSHTQSLIWPLVYFLSPASAYITGQALDIGSLTQPDSDVGSDAGLAHQWTQSLQGKIALVTGAGRGIGAAISRRLASEGARVIGLDRPADRQTLESLMTEIGGIPFAFDLMAPGSIQQIVSRLETEVGELDILVHNAGITRDKTLLRMPRDYWDDTLNVNLKAPMELTSGLVLSDSGLIRLMGPGGRVVFISSISGIAGNIGQTNYAAAKAGLIGYTEALAPKLAGRGITVNVIAPGFIETQMTQKMPVAIREVARRMNALGQGGVPDDIANAVFFLAAPGAQAISGALLRVCGQNLVGA